MTGKTLKTIVFSLGLATMTLTANSLTAQQGGGFINNQGFGSTGGGNIGNQSFGVTNNSNIGNQTFGNQPEMPLGSGLLIMVAAGASYALLKKKKQQLN